MFALDTNTLIFFFKGMGRVQPRLMEIPPSDIGIPAVVLYELQVGIAMGRQPARRRKDLDSVLAVITVLPFDQLAAQKASEISAALAKTGMKIGPMDNLIAGTALAHHATLVTHNTSEFQRVRGLTITDWY